MKQLLVLFSLLTFTCHAQSLERQIYAYYFKQFFAYEPAMIRENAITSISVHESQIRDSKVVYQRVKERITFRDDGRPILHVSVDPGYGDSIYKAYTYDEKGNLTAYRNWSAASHKAKTHRDLAQTHFMYEGNRLIKVFYSYSDSYSNNTYLHHCDSLIYNDKNQTITVLQEYAIGKMIPYEKLSYAFSKKNSNPKETVTYNEVYSPNKPVDKEALWATAINYTQKELKNLQRITQCTDLSNLLKVTACQGSFSDSSLVVNNGLQTTDEPYAYLNYTTCHLAIDSIARKVYCNTFSGGMQPTSLEDRVFSTHDRHTFDYTMRLLQTERLFESSRGSYERHKDSSITYYAYYENGLLERKLELHYTHYGFDNQSTFENENLKTPVINNNKPEYWLREERTEIESRKK